MKKLLVFAVFFFLISSASGQDLIGRICHSICNCLDSLENADSLASRLDRCVPETFSIIYNLDAEDEIDYMSDTDSLKKTLDIVMDSLTAYCPKIRECILEDKKAQYYRMSDSDLANEAYREGYEAFQARDLKTAEKKFLQAIKICPKWVYPYDDIGIIYRQIGDYKKAVRYYDKSLEIYPEGPYAIQNQAVAYLYLHEYGKALENYDFLIYLYPKDPEGYFGKGKLFFLQEDYENALDYILYSHKMYVDQNSKYVKDTESLISNIYNKMKEINKLDIFNQKLEAQGIRFNTD